MQREDEVVNLHEWVRLDSIQDLLQSYSDRLAKQELQIASLVSLCGELVSKETYRANQKEVGARLQILEQNVENLEENTSIYLNGERSVCRDALMQHQEAIEELIKKTADKINRQEHSASSHELTSLINSSIASIRNESAPIELIDRLQVAQTDIASKITVIDASMALKVDKSDMHQLEALAARLSKFSVFKDEAQDRLASLDQSIDALKSNGNNLTERVSSMHQRLINVGNELTKLAPRSEVRTLAREVEKHCMQLQQTATSDDMMEVKRNIGIISATADHNRSSVAAIHLNIDSIRADLRTKALASEVRACVLRTHFDEMLMALGTAVDTKASIEDLNSLAAHLKLCSNKLMSETKRIDLTVRFMEWFTSRGEAYEHNIRVIDKHLKHLTDDVHPSERKPFSELIRLTPSEVIELSFDKENFI